MENLYSIFYFDGVLVLYRWFSHDVTKIQTTKLSILLRFYFHDVLEQLKTNVHTNFHFKRVLGIVLEYLEFLSFCMKRLLHMTAERALM